MPERWVSLCVIVFRSALRHASKLASGKTTRGRISHVLDPPLVLPRSGTKLDIQSSESCTAASSLDRPAVVAGAEELQLMLAQDDRVAVNMLLLRLQAWNQDRVTQTESGEPE